jgi:gamma-glutamylputrescine oxidase
MDLLTANDREGEYPASLYAATANEHLNAGSLSEDLETDICIVGGGYTGLSAALHLARSGASVVLLEANRVGWGASGRNGGQVGAGQRLDPLDLQKLVGGDKARKLWDLAVEATDLVRALIDEHRIACDYRPGVLHTVIKPGEASHLREYVEHIRTEYGHDQATFVDKAELRGMLGTDLYSAGVLDKSAGHLHPLNYALGLGHAAKAAGARIFECSRVTDVSSGIVRTSGGSVKAGTIILACNGYLGELSGPVAAKVMPINNFIIATEPLGDDVARNLIRDNVAVADDKFVINYFRLSPDQRMIFGGGESYSYKFPSDIRGLVRRNMLKVYPQLKDARIDYAWGGTLAITMNRMPLFAEPAPGILSASGYSGHGIAIATLAGKVLAEKVSGNDARFRLFADVPHMSFPGGVALRSPLLALAMSWYRLRDELGV